MNLSKRELELLLEVIKKERLTEPISNEQGESLFIIENWVINKIVQNTLPRVEDVKKPNEEFIAIQGAINQISEAFNAGVSVDSLEVKTKEADSDFATELAIASSFNIFEARDILKSSSNKKRDTELILGLFKCKVDIDMIRCTIRVIRSHER